MAAQPRGRIAPGPACFSLCDVRRSKMCALLVNTLCNVNKFLSGEANAVQQQQEVLAAPHLTDFDRWAETAYAEAALRDDNGE